MDNKTGLVICGGGNGAHGTAAWVG